MEDPSHLEKMGRELKCPICLSLLNSAVSLTCNHVFCNACIMKSMKSGSNCPVCKVPYQRREARPSPHMDNLVSIYKSMEAASGFNIFVTQNPPPEISLDDEKRIESHISCRKRVHNKGAIKRRGLAKSRVENSDSIPLKPSFPTKKRVLVPHYPLSEMHIQGAKLGSGMVESSKDESRSLVVQEKDCILKETEQPILSPFFWLREEDAERSSQLTDGDQFEYITPPEVPSFSDIKDSDDEGSFKDKLHGNADVNLFDSEMFEWTQRECSPELLSSPVKMQVAETNEPALQSPKTVEPSANNCTGMTTRHDTVKEMLRDMPSSRTKVVNKKTQIHKSRGKGRKDKKNAQRKITEHGGSSLLAKTRKVTKVDDLDDHETEGKVSYVSATSENAETLYQDDACSNEYENFGTRKSCRRASVRCQQKSCVKSKKPKERLAKVDISHNQTNEKMNVHDSSLFIPAKQRGGSIKRAREVKSALSLRSEKGERHKKKMKVSFSGDTKNLLPEDLHRGNSEVPTERLSEVVQDSPAVGMSDGSSGKKLSSANGVALLKCETSTSKIKCAFCQTTEESEASGEMAHYYDGKPVPLDYNCGSKVIHSHKNCTEWAPNVYFENEEAINLKAELSRSKKIKCCCCGLKGAALGCYEKSCRKSFHVPCAKLVPQCRWDTENFVMLCPLHGSAKFPNETSESQERRTKRVLKGKQPITDNQLPTNNDVIAQKKWKRCGSASKMILCCSALTAGEREIISEFEKFSGVTELKRWDSRVTHIIASTDENGACKRTLKILMGILEGKWILNINWVKACIKALKPVDELQYEISIDVHGVRDGPRLGRLRLLNKQPKLFDGLKFYMMGDFELSYKGYLQDLIIAAGGNILHRKPISDDHGDKLSVSTIFSTFIVYSVELPDKCDSRKKDILTCMQSDAETLASSTGAKAVSNSWVLNSIAACKLQTIDE